LVAQNAAQSLAQGELVEFYCDALVEGIMDDDSEGTLTSDFLKQVLDGRILRLHCHNIIDHLDLEKVRRAVTCRIRFL
jgi:hypothetical protein